MKKWKGVALSPDNERKAKPEPAAQSKPKEIDAVQKENVKPEPPEDSTGDEPTVCNVLPKTSSKIPIVTKTA